MIPVHRGPLPDGLANRLRTKTLELGEHPTSATARHAWHGAGTVRRDLKHTLDRTAYRLAVCMYCQESRGTDVDHFRPIVVAPHLAFVWTNHLLACGYCNQQAKRDVFPVDADGSPLLLDPTRDDSGLHLALSSAGDLIPLSDRGEATIHTLRLNARPGIGVAREAALSFVEQWFRLAHEAGRALRAEELAPVRRLALSDALHFVAHAARRGDLGLLPRTRDIAGFVTDHLPVMAALFPLCEL